MLETDEVEDVENEQEPQYNSSGIEAEIVSRIYTASLKEKERCYLRSLLLPFSGAKCDEDTRTVDGEVCATFRGACSKRGLLTDDEL